MIDIALPSDVESILNTLINNHYEAFIVGGCVRDALLNRIPQDWDIATSALPESTLRLFKHTIPTGLAHGTVTVLQNGNSYEVTTFRIDGEYLDHRHPMEVEFTSSAVEDLSRRDFTINAMAYHPVKNLLDPFHGISDLKKGIIRCVGSPEARFTEDALRMLRAVRFACQLNFQIEQATYHAIMKKASLISKVSAERIRDELIKILLSDNPSNGILLLQKTGLLALIMPELERCAGFDQHNAHHDKDVFMHTLAVLDYTEKDLILRLSALLHDIGKPDSFTMDENGKGHFYTHHLEGASLSENLLRRLRFDNQTIKQVVLLIKEHMSKYDSFTEKTIKKLIQRVGIENLPLLFELQIADAKGHKPPYDIDSITKVREAVKCILDRKEPLSLKDLYITGTDLMSAGIKQGKEIGILLDTLLDIVLEHPEYNEKRILLKIALEKYNASSTKI